MWEQSSLLDVDRLASNDVHAMLVTYGVEAARATILREVGGRLAFGGGGCLSRGEGSAVPVLPEGCLPNAAAIPKSQPQNCASNNHNPQPQITKSPTPPKTNTKRCPPFSGPTASGSTPATSA